MVQTRASVGGKDAPSVDSLGPSSQRAASTPGRKRAKSEGAAPLALSHLGLLLVVIFGGSVAILGYVYTTFPPLPRDEVQHIKLPSSLEDAQNLFRVLSLYREQHFYQVVGAYFMTFVFLQTFAIPGSIFLSVLSGALFHPAFALFLVCLCSALGASLCYLLSMLFFQSLLLAAMRKLKLSERRDSFQEQVEEQKGNLLFYIVFLRVTPFLPNWFINVFSPVVAMPLTPFFFGTLVGVAPPSMLAVQVGKQIEMLSSMQEANPWQPKNVAPLLIAATLSVLPILLRGRLNSIFGGEKKPKKQ